MKRLDPAAPLCTNAARIVRVRLEELRSFVPAALDPRASGAQHDMRIAAKRLRYVLEIAELCFGEPGAAARRGARDLQGVLGDIHDCDVMLLMAEGHLRQLRELDAGSVRARAGAATELDPGLAAAAPHLASYRGLEILAVHLAARRRLLFDHFLELWAQQARSGAWDELEAVARELAPGGATLTAEGSKA